MRSAVASTTPPSSIGATLSPCRLLLATDSPSSANGYSASRSSGVSSRALAATSAATQEAAEPPMPEPSGIPFSSSTSNPNGRANASRSAIRALPAVLARACSGIASVPRTRPVTRVTRTSGSSSRLTVAMSPGPSITWPSRSKPTPMLPTLAGANAVATREAWACMGEDHSGPLVHTAASCSNGREAGVPRAVGAVETDPSNLIRLIPA